MYFEVYGNRVVMYRNRRYYSYDGIALSSFRPVEVLVPKTIVEKLKEEYVRKFVVFRSVANKSVVISEGNKVVSIYNRQALKQLTGKGGTLPERLYMRVRTLRRMDSGVFLIHWTEVLSYAWHSLVILAIYSTRSGLGMK